MTTRKSILRAIQGYRKEFPNGHTFDDGMTINELCQKLASLAPPKPAPPKQKNYSYAVRDFGDSWITKTLASKDEYPTFDSLGDLVGYAHYGGPGQRFTDDPHIEESPFSWLITQSGGWDV